MRLGLVPRSARPLLHFLLLGAALFGIRQLLPEPRQPVVVTPADVQHLRAQWQRDTGRAPTEAELHASVARHADEAVLLAEALRLRLDARDPVARERLLRNLRFAFPDGAAADEALLAQARALDMPRRDPVVRRRLVQVMERRFASRASVADADIAAYLERHAARYAGPERVRFRHVHFSADRPAAERETRAAQALAQLRAGQAVAGDPFLLGAEFDAPLPEVKRRFGAGFGTALAALPVGHWSGPVASAYGSHLVHIAAREPAAAPDPARLRLQAGYALLHERQEQAARDGIAALRARYRVELPPPAQSVQSPRPAQARQSPLAAQSSQSPLPAQRGEG